MTAKRTPIHRALRPRLTGELRAQAERLLELHDAHSDAITTEDDAFYDDGRHEELVDLLPIVNQALGIRPWNDGHAMLRAALAVSGQEER